MIEVSCNIMSGNSSVTTLPSLVAIGVVVVKMFLFCYVTKQDHVIKESGDYKESSSTK